VVLARLDVDAVARPYFLDRASLALDQASPLGDEDCLAVRAGVPAVRAPGAKCTIPPMTRVSGDGMLTTSI
jgi:hypothetical protein